MQYEYSATQDSWLQQAMFAKDKRKYLSEWRNRYETSDRTLNFNQFGFTPKLSDLEHLPSLSFILRVPFKLQKPYLSKDDHTFHLLDNPVRKDKVFQTPMVASTSWKGALRATFWQLGHQEDNKQEYNDQIIRLFGNDREDEKGQAGRLYFYPTFFDNIDKKKQLEVINPHDRKKGTGKNPILIECVPENATGEFILLYVPFGLVKSDEVAADLLLVVEGVEKMLTVYGFGAKTSSGFGTADVSSTGELAIRADLGLETVQPSATQPEPELPRYLIAPGKLHPDFQDSDGNLKLEAEYMKGKSGKREKQLYDKAKKWWEREGRQLAEAPAPELEPELEPPPKPSVTKVSFTNLSELGDRTQEVAKKLAAANTSQ